MPIHTIDANTLKQWLDNGEALLVDVRQPAEHKSESIPGSKLIPLANISQQKLPELNGKKLVIHCRSGKRSSSACNKLLAEAPQLEIYNLEGGITAWTEAGHEVATSDKFLLPLNRQVQLAIGLLLLLSSLLGHYFSASFFYWLTGFLGLGLTFSGVSGTCGLAVVLAKMPWNQGNISASSCCITKSK